MEINCILCVDKHNGISLKNNIPWSILDEQSYFNKITTYVSPMKFGYKNAILMGRNTYESLHKKYLTGRINYVITSNSDFISKINSHNSHNNSHNDSPLFAFDSIENAMRDMSNKNIDKLFIIGGSYLYNYFIKEKLVKYIYLTKLHDSFSCDNHVDIDNNIYNNIDTYTLIDSNTVELLNSNSNCMCTTTFMKYENMTYVNNIYWTYETDSTTNLEMPKINFDELQYLTIMKKIITKGHFRQTRNSNTYSLFGEHMVFNLSNNKLPLLTSKKMFSRGIIEELLFFLRGDTNSKILEDKGIKIWAPNTSETFLNSVKLNYEVGDMGPMYGFQWRHYGAHYHGCHVDYTGKGIDQFDNIINDLENNKYSRRILMTTYNPSQVNQGVLPPCHGITIQFGIENENKLCCHMYQRSADWALGVPFNIASYGLLVHIICNILETRGTKLYAGKLYMSFGDVHLYESHIESAKIQLNNIPYMAPSIKIKKSIENVNELTHNDFEIQNYGSHDKINYDMIA